jgi:hypothetical protein
MKKILMLLLLSASAIPAMSCGVDRMGTCGWISNPIRIAPVGQRLMNFRINSPAYRIGSAYTANSILRPQFTLYALNGHYSGIVFEKSAVFCRMENYFLNQYDVKFSIHAGGFSE